MKKKKPFIQLIKQILAIILYFFIAIVIYAIPIFSKSLDSSNPLTYTLSNISLYLIIMVIFIYIFRKTIIPDLYDFKKNGKKYLSNYYEYYIYGFIVMIVSNLIINLFIGIPSNEKSIESIIGISPIFYITLALIFAPITEELLTRVLLKDTFKHPIIYYILSGLIFGLLHIVGALGNQNYLELLFLIPYGALGFAFAVIYNKTNNVWSNIFFHSLHNFIAILVTFIYGGILWKNYYLLFY